VAEALVAGRRVVGDIEVDDGRVARVGLSPPGRSGLAVPGFVDLQVNGFAGVDLMSADEEGYRRAGHALAATGVTAYQPTFITSPLDAYGRALATVSELQPILGGPRVLGVHLEGPFISELWKGAHDADHILEPDQEVADRLLGAGPVTFMTLAAERPGAMDLIAMLISRRVTVSLGHTDADAAQAHAAFDAGARAVTHIFNAHRRFQPRDPGVTGVALARSDVIVTAIVDHVHLAPETAYVAYLAARGRFALVTDSTAAAGMGDGTYPLSHRVARVRGMEARLDDGTLAGSVLTMDQAARNLVALGVPLEEAFAAGSTIPARLAGRPDLGEIRAGGVADLAVLDDRLEVTRTFVDGAEVAAGST
jgi:N-acetylglucosamine-6-phosphate deacetylase